MRSTLSVLVCVMALAAMPYADVWDIAGDNDDSSGTDNELIHGSNQIHDLGVRPGPVADQDWYLVGVKRQTSFEVVIDATSGDIGFNTNLLQRVDGAGATIQNGVSISPGLDYSRSLRWANTAASTQTAFVRVGPANCTTACSSSDVYHIRAMETTISVARFNNAGSQITVLLSQNPTDVTINATYFYWSTGGTLLQTGSLALSPKALNVFNTTSFGTLVGVGGSITIAHDGPYGSLNVKSVALEPSTGFSFDTPGVYRGF
jgi:hypothetical protein